MLVFVSIRYAHSHAVRDPFLMIKFINNNNHIFFRDNAGPIRQLVFIFSRYFIIILSSHIKKDFVHISCTLIQS